ncbi:hypothetical protein HPP92_006861 [Vanilla planifolia]|nr:hypothetical protein HPP92_006861 [Vanilla planifolia]
MSDSLSGVFQRQIRIRAGITNAAAARALRASISSGIRVGHAKRFLPRRRLCGAPISPPMARRSLLEPSTNRLRRYASGETWPNPICFLQAISSTL